MTGPTIGDVALPVWAECWVVGAVVGAAAFVSVEGGLDDEAAKRCHVVERVIEGRGREAG